MSSYNILIIDDDLKLGNLIKDYFVRFNHTALYLSTPKKALETLEESSFDIVVLDIMMPEVDGFELCKMIRKNSAIPIIFLSARSETMDKILGLELGADDFLPKPFEPRELLARVESILPRSKSSFASPSSKTDLELDSGTMEVFLKGANLDFTSNEFLALNFLIKNRNKIVHRDELLNFLQGFDTEVYSRAIDILVSRIRQKLHDDAKNPNYIKTIRGQGYRFIGDASEKA